MNWNEYGIFLTNIGMRSFRKYTVMLCGIIE